MYTYSHTCKYIFKEKNTTDLRASNGGQGKKKSSTNTEYFNES